jgi:hypothetical protein
MHDINAKSDTEQSDSGLMLLFCWCCSGDACLIRDCSSAMDAISKAL